MDEKLTQRWLKQSHRQHKENSEYFSTFLRWTSINLSSIHLFYKRFLALITISRNPSKFHDIITVYLTRELNSFEFEWYDLSIDVTHQSYRWRHNCHRLISTAIRNSKKKKKNRIANFFPIRDRIINFNFACKRRDTHNLLETHRRYSNEINHARWRTCEACWQAIATVDRSVKWIVCWIYLQRERNQRGSNGWIKARFGRDTLAVLLRLISSLESMRLCRPRKITHRSES